MKLQRASPSETELATDRRSLMKSACLCLRISRKHGENQPWRPRIRSQRLFAGADNSSCDPLPALAMGLDEIYERSQRGRQKPRSRGSKGTAA